jgi:flagellar biosynthetic protein FliR
MPGPFGDFLAGQVWAVFLVFARIGSAFAVLPGFAEASVPARVRLLLAAAITLVIAPVVSGSLPPLPPEPMRLALIAGTECATGLFIGLVARMMLAAAHVAGMIIGFQTSLANAFAFDPATQQQGVITAAWMSVLALVVMFAADLHHVLLRALADSYDVFPAGRGLDPGEFAEAASQLVSRSFALGLRMAMPFLVYALLLFVALGLMQRLMPQMQVFFVALPLQLTVGIVLLALCTGVAMVTFVEDLAGSMTSLLRLR